MRKFVIVFKDSNHHDVEIEADGYNYQFTAGNPHLFFEFYKKRDEKASKWDESLFCSINVDSVLYIKEMQTECPK